MSTPFISVVMPVYNGAKYLSHALNSIVQQKEFNKSFEVIIADDKSSDNSREIITSFKESLPITLIDGAGIGNWVASTNKAMKLAKGEWICFLHQDDMLQENKFVTIDKLSQEYSDVNIIVHPITYIDSNGKSLGKPFLPFPNKPLLSSEETTKRLITQNIIMVSGTAFRKSSLESIGLLDESLKYTADWDFWMRFCSTQDIAYSSEALGCFRVHNESQTIGFAEKQVEYRNNLDFVVNKYHTNLIKLYGEKYTEKLLKMARLGIALNCFLSIKGTGGKASPREVISNIFKCGIISSLQYFSWAKVFPRVFARILSLKKHQ